MKVLFVMRNHGYLRNYASTIALLASRGHEVVVASRGPERHMAVDTPGFLDALCRQHPGISSSKPPRRADDWATLAMTVRAARNALRYRHPIFRQAPKLAARAEQHLVARAPRLASWLPSSWPVARSVDWGLRIVERAIPTGDDIDTWLDALVPDALVVTPLVDFNSLQSDYVKSARRRGIPVALAVASWDNLTNKGVIAVQPHRLFVWNEAQKEEAVHLHHVAASDVSVVGAPLFDSWFAATPTASREDFCARLGLEAARPYLLYLCSSGFIAPNEPAFVRRWVQGLRQSSRETLRSCGVLVRPHPGSAGIWADVNMEALGSVAVWPRRGAMPLAEDDKRDYFDSLHHAAAVVGINTSGMIEAGIVGRRSFTILDPSFAETQEGTVHFAHLTRSAFLMVAHDTHEHHDQLAAELAHPSSRETFSGFLRSFVRPAGLDVAATPRLADAIEALVRVHPLPELESAAGRLIARTARAVLVPHA